MAYTESMYITTGQVLTFTVIFIDSFFPSYMLTLYIKSKTEGVTSADLKFKLQKERPMK